MSASSIFIALACAGGSSRSASPSVALYSLAARVVEQGAVRLGDAAEDLLDVAAQRLEPHRDQAIGMVALGGHEVGLLDLVLRRRLRDLEHLEQVLRLDDRGLGRAAACARCRRRADPDRARSHPAASARARAATTRAAATGTRTAPDGILYAPDASVDAGSGPICDIDFCGSGVTCDGIRYAPEISRQRLGRGRRGVGRQRRLGALAQPRHLGRRL